MVCDGVPSSYSGQVRRGRESGKSIGASSWEVGKGRQELGICGYPKACPEGLTKFVVLITVIHMFRTAAALSRHCLPPRNLDPKPSSPGSLPLPSNLKKPTRSLPFIQIVHSPRPYCPPRHLVHPPCSRSSSAVLVRLRACASGSVSSWWEPRRSRRCCRRR